MMLLEKTMYRIQSIGKNELYTLNKRLFLNFPQL